MEYVDSFGFLNHEVEIITEDYKISLCDDFSRNKKFLEAEMFEDGYCYPPVFMNQNKRRIARQLWGGGHFSSHLVESQLSTTEENFRHVEGGFIIKVLSFLYNTRLEFTDLWFDGRVNLTQKPLAKYSNDDLSNILDTSIVYYRNLTGWKTFESVCKNSKIRDSKLVLNNALYFYLRARTLVWAYDRFQMLYTAFDAIWKVAVQELGISKSGGHKARLVNLCELLDIEVFEDLIDQIYELRNDAVHEASFGDTDPNKYMIFDDNEDTWKSYDFITITDQFQNFIERVIWRMIGITPTYYKHDWKTGYIGWPKPFSCN